jgi:hypothetical protein
LQAAACTYRIALGPRAGQKVLSLRTVAGRDEKNTTALCADAHGFSLGAAVRSGTHQRKELERLCRYITRPAIANERQQWRNSDVCCGFKPTSDFIRQRTPNSEALILSSSNFQRPLWPRSSHFRM